MPALTVAVRRAMPIMLATALITGCIAEGPFPSTLPRPSLSSSPAAREPSPKSSALPTGSGPTSTPEPAIEDRGPGFDPPPSATPPVVVEPGVRRADAEVDGVRITIQSARNPLAAGEPAWVATTLTNTGRDALHWITDSCAIHVGVLGEMPLRWAGGFAQAGVAKTFKEWAYVANLPDLNRPIWLDTTPEAFVGQGDFGCDTVGVPHELAPGRSLRQRHLWDGLAAPNLGLPPSGPAEWIGTFSSWWRDADPGAVRFENPRAPIVVRLPVEIVLGRDRRDLSAGQAIDVAVTVPAFRALLEANPSIQDWDMPITTHVDHVNRLWQIGLRTDDGRAALVHIRPSTGEVVGVDVTP